MTRVDTISAAWFVLSLTGVAWIATLGSEDKQTASAHTRSSVTENVTYAQTSAGSMGVIDANGVVVPIKHYERVASASTLADALVSALLEPERVIAMTDYGRAHTDEPQRYGARMRIAGLHQTEELISARVDLIVLNHVRSQAELSRLRQAGMAVFNLGEMRGLSTLIPNIHAFAALIGEPERGVHYEKKLLRRMHAVAADIPPAQRKRALYVSAYANQLFGGALGTSYHDVLTHAGLQDVSEGLYTGWVRYDPEQILTLNPELIIANDGTGAALCRIGGLDRLRACQNGGAGIITLPSELLGDPGPRMLDAAEALRAVVYGEIK